ncbi:LIV-I protein H [Variovorax sp. PBS-H4]|uniref:branched-chain amino acid ABC transporter permease n=1 Tax=Variovorax sp. PBS-H4 TaxID=434008 RepID=UPI0013199ABB|nr:branched-chain amino acid ABC transporter permease [Variovorax sp. PBS-H4]VTU36518.1 LIV-I protein H [Variovorax sp. PBS-H4]
MIDVILSQSVNGLVLGFLFILISIGLSIVFGLLGIVNVAHGAFFALGAYFALTLQQQFGWPAVILAPVGVGIVGMVVEVLLVRRLYGKDPLMTLVLTFALSLFIESIIRTVWGSSTQPLMPPAVFQGFIEYGPVLTTTYRAAVLGITVALLLGLWAFLSFTPYGRILRAGSRDPQMVGMLGINLPRVLTGAFGVGCMLAGAAGVLAGPLWSVTPGMSSQAIMPAFVIVTIGGLGSYGGAVIAGLLVGLTTAMTTQFYPAAAGVAMYLLMAAILLVRPRGLFGEHWEHF